jgi:hypothetical protein
MPAISELDAIVEQSLRSFYEDICSEWYGRENEMVNLYAWSHLAKHVRPDTILHDLGQIGIEVAVRQLPKEVLLKWKPKAGKPKKQVRKDLVIWPSARMSLWKAYVPCNEPLAIMEWKVNHFLNRDVHQKNRRDYLLDVHWLRETSAREGMGSFIGYAVMVEDTRTPKALICTRVQAGAEGAILEASRNRGN